MQQIQYLGALNTYYKRYLYLNAFGITDGEVIDSMNNKELLDNKEAQKKKYFSVLKANNIANKDFSIFLKDNGITLDIDRFLTSHEYQQDLMANFNDFMHNTLQNGGE